MNHSMLKRERITAVVSTLVAIAILAAGVTAHQSHAPQGELERLQSDLQFQLDWAFRHDSKERSQRIARLEETIEAWNASPRSEEDRKLFASWLLESTIRSMPGTTKPLQRVPEFGKPHAVDQPRVVALAEPVATAREESNTVQLTQVAVLVKKVATTPVDDVAVEVASVKLSAEHGTKLTGNSTPEQPETPSETSETLVKINFTELTARIAGYHDGLDQIETVLLFANAPNLVFLEHQVQELVDLTRDFRFIKLYHEALSVREREQVTAPRTMNATLAEVERLLNRYENQQDGDFLGSFDPAQRKRIENLRQKLATLAGSNR